MSTRTYFIYLIIMAVTTYLIRAVPFAAVKKKIENRFIRSFLYYIPLCGTYGHDNTGYIYGYRKRHIRIYRSHRCNTACAGNKAKASPPLPLPPAVPYT